MTPIVAVVGPVGNGIEGVLRCQTPHEAVEARASLVVMGENDWLSYRREAPETITSAVVTDSPGREVCGDYLLDARVKHVLFNGPNLHTELEETVAIVSGSSELTPHSLGLGRIVLKTSLRSSDDQRVLLEEATRLLKAAGARGRAAENWLDALAESLTNAVYNAPRKAEAAPFLGLHRKHAVTLDETEAVEVTLFASERHVSFSVTDAFGSLTQRQFQGYLGRALGDAPAKAVEKPGGAGLGLMMMFDRLERLVAMVEPGHRTAMVGIGPLSYGRARVRGRSVQFFSARAPR